MVDPSPDRRPKPWKEYGRYGSVGIELVLSLLLGLWLGTKADAHFHTAPYLTLLGMIVGAYAGFRVVWKAAQHMTRDAERAERRDRGEDPWLDEAPIDDRPLDDPRAKPKSDPTKRDER